MEKEMTTTTSMTRLGFCQSSNFPVRYDCCRFWMCFMLGDTCAVTLVGRGF